MARGNHLKPGTGQPTIAERAATTKARETERPEQTRHVYVQGVAGETEGLLVEWRKTGDEWEARVIYTTELRTERRGVVDEWVAAGDVRPRG